MAALNFPNSPSTNDIHTENGVSFKWNGTIWKKVGSTYTDTTNLNVTGIGTFAGAVNIAGVLTYEDVKNVDSVGIITARTGLSVTAGDVVIPDTIVHAGDTNTKIRFPGADQFSIETAGSQRLLTRADGRIQITSGNFEVIGAEGGNAEIRLTADEGDDGADYWRFQSAASGNNLNIATYTSGSWVDKVSITSAGNVGIGEDDPDTNSNLHIKAATVNQLRLETTDNSSYGIVRFVEGDHDGTKDKYIIGYNDSHSAQADQLSIKNQVGDITFMAGGVATTDEKLRITSDGKLGLGVASPASESGWGNILHVNSASAGAHIRFTDNSSGSGAGDGSYIGHYGNDTYLVNKESSGVIIFNTNSAERLRILSTGETCINDVDLIVGHGQNTQAQINFFANSDNASARYARIRKNYNSPFNLEYFASTSDSDQAHVFYSDLTTERLRITSLGEVNIGNGAGYAVWNNTGNDQRPRFQLKQTAGDNRGVAFLEERGDSNGMDLFISKSRGGSGAGAINAGDTIGILKFSGADGTRQHNCAGIQAWNSGTVATGRVAGNISVYTAPDSVAGLAERIRILSDGVVHLRQNTNTNQGIEWYSPSHAKSASIGWGNGNANFEFKNFRADNQADNPYANIDFFTGSTTSPTRALRITEDGNVIKERSSRFAARINYINKWYSAGEKIEFMTPHVNVGSDFDTSNHRYQAPVDGTYFFWFHTNVIRNSSGVIYTDWYVNNSNTTPSSGGRFYGYWSNGWENHSGCIGLALQEGDYVSVHSAGGNDKYDGGQYGQFMGYLVG